jgi:N-hydroxyarylamine O-acetyltransferase
LEEGVYLADVGFGDGPLDPMRVVPGEFSDGRFAFKLTRMDDGWWRFHNAPEGGAESFDFSLSPADETLLAERCAFLQVAEISPFVQNLVCQRHTEAGLIVLRGRVLRTIRPGDVSQRLIAHEREFMMVLREQFGLDVPEAASLWPKIEARHQALFADKPF